MLFCVSIANRFLFVSLTLKAFEDRFICSVTQPTIALSSIQKYLGMTIAVMTDKRSRIMMVEKSSFEIVGRNGLISK